MAREVVNVHDLPAENHNEVAAEGERDCSVQRIDIGDRKGGATASLKGDNGVENVDLNMGQIDGFLCPI
ncbi:hypothetical protein ACS0TY_015105 [Phlomoides rotata]